MFQFNFLKGLSIKTKIIGIILAISFFALSSGLVVMSLIDIYEHKRGDIEQFSLDAILIGDRCVVPLETADRQLAKEKLARLSLINSIEEGLLFDATGNLFAWYPENIENPAADGLDYSLTSEYRDGFFYIVEPILSGGTTIGKIYLKANAEQFLSEVRNQLKFLFLVYLVVLAISIIMAVNLHYLITKPINELASLTARASETGDYNIIMEYNDKDEIGILYGHFKNFLSQIYVRGMERDAAEHLLRQREEKYRFLFDKNPAPMIVYETSTLNVLDVNEAFQIMYGYTEDEAQNMRVIDLFHEKEKESLAKMIKSLKGHANTGEWHHVKKDGTVFPIMSMSHDMVFNDTEARIVSVTDITQIRETEKEISFLAQVIRNINECVSITDMESKIIFVNNSWQKTFGYSEQEVKGRKTDIIISPSNPKGTVEEIFNSTLKGSWQGELITKRKNGTEFPVLMFRTIIRDNKDKPIALVGISSDITENKKIQKELEEYRENLEKLIAKRTNELNKLMEETSDLYENAPCGYHSIDANGIIVRINNTELKWLGYEKEEVVGKLKALDFLTEESKSNFEVAFQELKAKGEINNVEFEFIRKDGTTFIVSLNATSILDDNGSFLRSRTTVFDITESKQIEIALEKAIQDAENASRIKSEFLANMSHEIRTPMNAVLGYTDLLSSLLTDQTQKKYIESIKSSGRSLLTLINDILDLSKIEAGRLDLEYDFVDSNFFFKEFERIFALKAQEKGIMFKVEIDSGTPAGIYVVEPRLRQIVFNLIGNAMKFTSEGHVILRVYTDNLQTVKYKKDKSEEFIDLFIEVEDTGIGISKELWEEIFDPFVQIKSRKNFGGTGLGLAITKRLVTLMKGTVELKSELDKGSTFIVRIPNVAFLREYADLKKDFKIDPSSVIFNKSVLLVIDDVEHNRSYIKDALNDTKIVVIEADEGYKALELAVKNHPDLIISDIRMPNMDGFELLKKIKGIEKLKNIPVLAYSASVLKDQKEKIHNSDFSGLLTKPLNISELYVELMNYLPYKMVEKQKGPPSPPDNGKSHVKDLAGLLNSLETSLMEDWKSFEVMQPIDGIRKFGNKLVDLGKTHNSNLVINYGEELCSSANSFDIDAILKLLKKYLPLIEEIKSHI